MPAIKVTDIAWGRLQSPDLDLAEQFLTDFGMVRAARTSKALYMRGSDPNHHLHVTELGEPRYIGLAYYAANEDDLAKVAALPGASGIEHMDEPGGGKRVRLRDPDGYQIEVVHGLEPVAPLPLVRNPLNLAEDRTRRAGDLNRLKRGPAQVMRMGHGVIMTRQIRKALEWYRGTLGFLPSDEVYRDDPNEIVGSFNRCDRGETFVDHHVFFCIAGERTGLNHFSYEVRDIDDVMMGHEHLRAKGYKHMWGIGRHHLGSQVYDYWSDPWGRVHEHWTDSDRINVHHVPSLAKAGEGTRGPWGDPAPREFQEHASP
ncbi:MAG TPA: VOC family protein [Stellaceae bacterium]|nr:VOC family protein [Stellaceae bacterium]